MSNIKYPGVVRAARAIGTEKKALAEALYLAIPPRRGRPVAGTLTIDEQLAEAAIEIERETGEVYAPETLSIYRLVAAWVAGNGVVYDSITWADASWTAHREAYGKGISWAEFVAGKRAKRTAAKTEVTPPSPAPADPIVALIEERGLEQVVQSLSQKQRDGLGTELRRKQREEAKEAAGRILQDELENGVSNIEGEQLRSMREAHNKLHQPLIEASYTLVQVREAWPEWRGRIMRADLESIPGILTEMENRIALLRMVTTDDVVGEVLRHESRQS